MVAGSYLAVQWVVIKPEWLYAINNMIAGTVILSITMILARFVAAVITKHTPKSVDSISSVSILTNLLEATIYMIGFLIILQTYGVSVTPLLTALGVGGLAVALALQDTLSNLFSGLHLLLSGQIKAGEYIKLSSGEEGYVVDISWRSTTIAAMGNNLIIIPNQKMATAIITNYHMPDREISVLVPVCVSYDSDLEHVETVTINAAQDIMLRVVGSMDDFAPVVRFSSFEEIGVQFNVILRAREFADQYVIRHEFIKHLHALYERQGIRWALPVRRIWH